MDSAYSGELKRKSLEAYNPNDFDDGSKKQKTGNDPSTYSGYNTYTGAQNTQSSYVQQGSGYASGYSQNSQYTQPPYQPHAQTQAGNQHGSGTSNSSGGSGSTSNNAPSGGGGSGMNNSSNSSSTSSTGNTANGPMMGGPGWQAGMMGTQGNMAGGMGPMSGPMGMNPIGGPMGMGVMSMGPMGMPPMGPMGMGPMGVPMGMGPMPMGPMGLMGPMGPMGPMAMGPIAMNGPVDIPENASSIVFVGNLPYDVHPNAIYQALIRCGNILDIRTCFDKETNQPKGFCFVEFTDVAAAARAVAMNGVTVMGRPIKVEFSSGKSPGMKEDWELAPGRGRGGRGIGGRGRGGREQDNDATYGGWDDSDWGNYGDGYGVGYSGGYGGYGGYGGEYGGYGGGGYGGGYGGFGGYGDGYGGYGYDGGYVYDDSYDNGEGSNDAARPDFVPPPIPDVLPPDLKTPPPGCSTVFMGNLSEDIVDDIVFRMFGNCGDIKQIRWLTDKQTGKFMNCGFVEFYEAIAAHRAMLLNGTLVFGRSMRVDYSSEKKPPRVSDSSDGSGGDGTAPGGTAGGFRGRGGRGGRGGPRGRGAPRGRGGHW